MAAGVENLQDVAGLHASTKTDSTPRSTELTGTTVLTRLSDQMKASDDALVSRCRTHDSRA